MKLCSASDGYVCRGEGVHHVVRRLALLVVLPALRTIGLRVRNVGGRQVVAHLVVEGEDRAEQGSGVGRFAEGGLKVPGENVVVSTCGDLPRSAYGSRVLVCPEHENDFLFVECLASLRTQIAGLESQIH